MNVDVASLQTPSSKLVGFTELAQVTAQALQWPEEALCGGQPNATLTEEGVAYVQGILPLLRYHYRSIDSIATEDLPGNHPDYDVAVEIRERIGTAVMIIGALAVHADTGVQQNLALYRAWDEIRVAHELAESHHSEKTKKPTAGPVLAP